MLTGGCRLATSDSERAARALREAAPSPSATESSDDQEFDVVESPPPPFELELLEAALMVATGAPFLFLFGQSGVAGRVKFLSWWFSFWFSVLALHSSHSTYQDASAPIEALSSEDA